MLSYFVEVCIQEIKEIKGTHTNLYLHHKLPLWLYATFCLHTKAMPNSLEPFHVTVLLWSSFTLSSNGGMQWFQLTLSEAHTHNPTQHKTAQQRTTQVNMVRGVTPSPCGMCPLLGMCGMCAFAFSVRGKLIKYWIKYSELHTQLCMRVCACLCMSVHVCLTRCLAASFVVCLY